MSLIRKAISCFVILKYYESVFRAEAESIDRNMFSVNSRCSRMFYVCSTKGIVSSMRHFLFL